MMLTLASADYDDTDHDYVESQRLSCSADYDVHDLYDGVGTNADEDADAAYMMLVMELMMNHDDGDDADDDDESDDDDDDVMITMMLMEGIIDDDNQLHHHHQYIDEFDDGLVIKMANHGEDDGTVKDNDKDNE
eukprot:12398671-Karenia_brevis.AAC.1